METEPKIKVQTSRNSYQPSSIDMPTYFSTQGASKKQDLKPIMLQ